MDSMGLRDSGRHKMGGQCNCTNVITPNNRRRVNINKKILEKS